MSEAGSLLITGGVLAGRPVDVHITGDRIVAVTDAGTHPPPGGIVVDACGARLLPGLHDHHLHLRAWAAAGASVQAGPPEVVDPAGLAAALRAAPEAVGGWVRAVGYHQSVAGDLDRVGLDRMVADRPVRLQHRSGALWILNSKALSAVGLSGAVHAEGVPDGVERDGSGRATGRLWRADDWLGARVPRADAIAHDQLAAMSRVAAARGVTGFTDATPDRTDAELRALSKAATEGVIGQRLHLMAPLDTSLGGPARGVTIGPVKVLLDDDRLPTIGGLADTVAGAHRERRPVAIHCVTRVQAVVALAALEAVGTVSGDRIEHGAVLAAEQLGQLRRMGLTVVTQPGFVSSRGDRYLADVEPADLPDLWRLRSLLVAGVRLAASSDAPLGPSDPWQAIEASIQRRSATGRLVGGAEAVGWEAALRLWSGHPGAPWIPRRVAPGEPADLCALQAGAGSGVEVVLTVARGVVLHQAGT